MKSVVYINGDGIGTEVMQATREVIDRATCGAITWIPAYAGLQCLKDCGSPLPDETLELLRTHKVGIKGPTETPLGSGHTSVNVRLRQELDLFTGLRPVHSLGLPNTREGVNIALFRENVEGLYECAEECDHHTVVLTARFTYEGMHRLAQAAFQYARRHGHTRVTHVTKKNIHKGWGALYQKAFDAVIGDFPDIKADHLLVDALAMNLVLHPERFGVIVTENMFGDIISDLLAGLVGGLGVVPGANIGTDIALFEAVHGSAPDIVGKGIANPTALMLSGAMMLDHLQMFQAASRLRFAVTRTLRDGERTRDLGGELSTHGYTQAVLSRLD